jgi:phosphoglycolate phosphatase
MRAPLPPLQDIAAVLFDLDGTFADTAPDLAYAVNAQRRRRNQEPLPIEVLRPHVSSGARGMLREGLGLTPGHEEYETARQEFLRIYSENICRDTRLFDGMEQLIDELEGRGLRWGIVTNKQSTYTEPLLEALDITRRAGCIVSGDTTPHAKPHPAPLLEASARLGVAPSRCAYLGDDERDVQASQAAGMIPVVALYGYLGLDKPPEQWGASLYLSAPLDLLKLLGAPLSMG